MSDKSLVIRGEERQRLIIAACLRRAGQMVLCELANLSEKGCKVRASANFVSVGDVISIKPDGLEGMTGTVRWKNEDWMGVEFHQSMYRPVVDHLVRSHLPKT